MSYLQGEKQGNGLYTFYLPGLLPGLLTGIKPDGALAKNHARLPLPYSGAAGESFGARPLSFFARTPGARYQP